MNESENNEASKKRTPLWRKHAKMIGDAIIEDARLRKARRRPSRTRRSVLPYRQNVGGRR